VNRLKIPAVALLALGSAAVAVPWATAQPLRREPSALSALAKPNELLAPREALQPLADVRSSSAGPVQDAWAAFTMVNGDWISSVDARNGRIESAEGTGIPWIPGAGNHLQNGAADLPALETLARRFVAAHPAFFGVADKQLRLSAERSGRITDHLWTVDFDVVLGGLPVEGARLLFRVGHGNLIQIGSEFLPPAGATAPPVQVSRDKAFAALSDYLGGLAPLPDELVDAGSLHLLPTVQSDSRLPEGFAYGKGYGLVTVWQFIFRREDAPGTWRARVDATTGELIEFIDIDVDARATGGVASDTIAGTEVVRPMPFTDLGGGLYTDTSGRYTYNGTTRTSTFNGLYARATDSCGATSLSGDANGNLLFGSAAGNNCTTPGVGGAGNTRSSRTSFYFVNRGKDMARGWLPGVGWLNAQLTANVNLAGTCNGFWNGATLQLYQAVPGACGASGEEPGFILHEYGHGLDANDGTGFNGQTSESYGDLTAAINLHNSCIGPGFRTANCGAYGDACTACTGLRDIDWARHVSGVPHTVANYTQLHCGTGGGGPCGGEVHCESHIPSEAVWDFANRDLPAPGTNAAWNVLERLWYLSRTTATNGFACTTGMVYTSNGCNAGSWWKTMRAVDDDDGNLANGTPHSCNLFAAFNRHGIACAADPGANTCFRGCMPSGAPTVSYTGGYNSVAVNVSGTGVFDIYRNELGCNAGFTKIANDVGAGTFTDTGVANGTTYYYQAVAQPVGNEACASTPSTCTTVTLAASSYEGYHDNADCRSIFGWAWDQNRPNTPIDVDLYKDGVKVQNLQANLFRADLLSAGKGNGVHAFTYTPDGSYFDGVWHSMQVRFGGMATSLGTTPKSLICGVTIFTTQTPAAFLDTGGTVYTVATQFSSSVNGYITALRFRKATGETGTNTGTLYTNTGTSLGTANLNSCDANGWCSGTLSSPVAITAGTLYRVAVNTNTKQSKTDCGIGSGITNGPLTAWQGYWIAGTGFPTTSSCSNFFVDVKFDL
jgi:hypothetical protein